MPRVRTTFQPTPRFVSGANVGHAVAVQARVVSTHAPLRQRGERHGHVDPPGRVRRFNPRPASSAGRTRVSGLIAWVGKVSTHAPLRQRGEPIEDQCFNVRISFNPRPASSAGRTTWSVVDDPPVLFQPTPRFVSGANPDGITEQFRESLFQPTPRFVSGANHGRDRRLRGQGGFNPRPASSAGRTVGKA